MQCCQYAGLGRKARREIALVGCEMLHGHAIVGDRPPIDRRPAQFSRRRDHRMASLGSLAGSGFQSMAKHYLARFSGLLIGASELAASVKAFASLNDTYCRGHSLGRVGQHWRQRRQSPRSEMTITTVGNDNAKTAARIFISSSSAWLPRAANKHPRGKYSLGNW